MRNRSRKYNIRQELRKIVYMLCMIFIIFMADIVVANATTDDGTAAGQILDNQQRDENRTNINEPGSAKTGEDLQELNIANRLEITYDSGNGELNGTLRILLILTAIAVLPILLVTITSFTRILIVLHFTRQALNTQSAPPNQVLIAISLFLTFLLCSRYLVRCILRRLCRMMLVRLDLRKRVGLRLRRCVNLCSSIHRIKILTLLCRFPILRGMAKV